jgi:DNA replication and repair protein RecF
MHLNHLSLKNYRSYNELELPLEKGSQSLLGATVRVRQISLNQFYIWPFSHLTEQVATEPLVQLGSSLAYIRGKVDNGEREILVELEVNAEKANRARINQNPVRSQKELYGILQAIYFSPEDLDSVRGDPSEAPAGLSINF